MLMVRDLSIRFGGLSALDSVSLSVERGSITALIGPNGAGKTTFFNCLTGVYRPGSGSAQYRSDPGNSESRGHGQDDGGQEYNLLRYPNHKVVQLGVVRTFQNIRLFSQMTVLENLLIGAHSKTSYSALDVVCRTRRFIQGERRSIEECHAVLCDLGLDELANEVAANLPYGMQKRLEIARALASRPRLLLLDEPAAGMNPQETRSLMELLRTLKEKYSFTVFLIEHDMHFVMNLSDKVYVLDYGKLIASGTPDEVRNNPRTIEAYLGKQDA